ncbi:MAG: hypothetical protein HYV68_01380 [Candidatus Taylorbacteria bacterium]|nr:hypothetical protein [Candidatus Taylorbacteria bacterium]
MKFKSWPYWVKGAAIAIIPVLIGLLSIPLGAGPLRFILGISLFLPLILSLWSAETIFRCDQLDALDHLFKNPLPPCKGEGPDIFGLIAGLSLYVLAGASLGWLYGKIKNRKLNAIR